MGLIQAFKRKLHDMAAEDLRRSAQHSTPIENRPSLRHQKDNKGIALLMVLSAVSVLSFLVSEFSYFAQFNQKLAYDSLDSVQAHYLAKSGFKLSLLRLKAYQTVKSVLAAQGGASGGGGGVPKTVLDKIWSFPFMYPVPTNVPGLSLGEKEAIEKFQKASNLQGSFTSVIESESSRLNVNMILAGFQPTGGPSPSPSPSASPSPSPAPGANPSPSPSPSFNPEVARKSLQDYLQEILQAKFDKDPDFQAEYRDFRVEEFMDNLIAWADPTYERKQSGLGDHTAFKRAPFYSMTELHMLPGMDDQLYDLFAPNLTVSRTPGLNINTMQEAVLRAIVPQMTDKEVTDFFTFRDSAEDDNSFKDADAFYKYLATNVAAFKSDEGALNKLKTDLQKRNIRLVTDESEFKITVQATINQSVRRLVAWVTLQEKSKSSSKSQGSGPNSTPSPTPGSQPTPSQVPDSGLKINFMRVS